MKKHYQPILLVALITLGSLSVEVINPLLARNRSGG